MNHDTSGDALTPGITRRRALVLLGGGALAVFAACGSDDDSGSAATSDCPTIPEETEGPFPADGSNGPNVLTRDGIVRRDIRSSFGSSNTTALGVPLTIILDLVDSSGCKPLEGAAVYLWQCNRDGAYSLYSDGLENENYLRGIQESDEEGRVTFTSVFPGAYEGRWPHIHLEVYESLDSALGDGTRNATSQIALPEDACTAVYKTAGYEGSAAQLPRTTLTSDVVFRNDGGKAQLGTASGSASAGYTLTLQVPVDPDYDSAGSVGPAPPGARPDGAPPEVRP